MMIFSFSTFNTMPLYFKYQYLNGAEFIKIHNENNTVNELRSSETLALTSLIPDFSFSLQKNSNLLLVILSPNLPNTVT